MDFVGNVSLFAAGKHFTNRSRIDKVIAMVTLAQFFLTHSVYSMLSSTCVSCSRPLMHFVS